MDIKRSGVLVDFPFTVFEHRVYNFAIRFKYQKKNEYERKRVKKVIGSQDVDRYGNIVDPGVATLLSIRILKKMGNSELVVYEKTGSPSLTSWADGSFAKKIGHCDLAPGNYRVVLESKEAHEEYEDIPTSFLIGADKYKVAFDAENMDRRKTCPW